MIGRTDIDGIGTAGLEVQYDNVLAGKPGEFTLEVAPGGSLDRRQRAGRRRGRSPGNDIVLTIDRSVQYAAEQALLAAWPSSAPEAAQAIVMSTKTGEILAMASVRINDERVTRSRRATTPPSTPTSRARSPR